MGADDERAIKAKPFLICGMPRSGTTLLAELLARTPGVHVTAETHFLASAPRSWWADGIDRPGLLAHLERLRTLEACRIDRDELTRVVEQ